MRTPYDFIIIENLLPHVKHVMDILNSIIDFSLSLTELRYASAEGIFIGSLLYSCMKKKEKSFSYDIIKAITNKWEEGI
jgi:hypothetical protein